MISGTCHCGAVRFELEGEPEQLVDCNCSRCRRLGALWAHADNTRVTIDAEPGATQAYVWGDRTLESHTCRTCGCTTHWLSLKREEPYRVGVNCRMCDPESISHLRVRRLDGADTWQFLD